MNTPNPPEQPEHADDAQFSQWLSPLARDGAPFEQDVFDRVVEVAGDVFAKQPAQAGGRRVTIRSGAGSAGRQVLMRAALAIGAVAIALVLVLHFGPAGGEITLGSILDNAAAARSLELRIDADGHTAQVVVLASGHLRWQQSPTRYEIAAGARLWRIDEQANTVEAAASPWFDADRERIDLLSLVGVGRSEAERFRASVSSGIVELGGRPCHIFRAATGGDAPRIIEAYADVDTRELRSIAVWPEGRRTGAPLAELTLVRRDIPVDEADFAVATSLAEDGRIGKITDAQGIVTLRPLTSRRWTPVARLMLIKPGDWLRTDVRGANAATLAMTSQFKVIAGPGSLVELVGPHRLKLHGGEVHVTGAGTANGVVEIAGPGDGVVAVKAGESSHYAVGRDGSLRKVARVPKWLAAFEGTSADESIGSLVARIDGRDVPLSVGFHKVNVEIRDQIARTTIEQSFVNRTNSILEGVFHFPLPQDASISGFGMWINGELVEADVVEKQRAREIYETILRERRDPGLLEWTGGNIFKASVFPINPHSEKRIRIVYTQVLPLVANRYRYSYGLRSELLRKTPVRELSLEVNIHSARQLKTISCSTHAVRSQATGHSARLEFAAQEYTPERDFEVVCELESGQPDVVVIPHRRGADGYFLIQLVPPAAEGNWQREILPDGTPLELLVVCDTSASMDSEKRRQQDQCLAAIVAALGPQDRFNVAACDVRCDWLLDRPAAPSDEAMSRARQWLADRPSLGWTDLDRMIESILPRLGRPTHVVYIGDGIVTARDADPQAFVTRLQQRAGERREGAVHAVSVGNSFDSTVLNAVARLGGGSVRQITGEQTPQRVAFELLNEIAQPALRDLRVEFRGLRVAAIYPDQLPNLAAGTQQTIIGRYLPEGEDQSGEVVVSGKRGDETVRYTARITLADAESGNSFIPRLWARAHLDHLLAQGTSPLVRDEIIAMSEEFHIITPYTSLLVLETDEDRERFGVKRRFQMRDGERFFAEGRDNAAYELLQQHMKLAGDWRLDLRRQFLLELTRLGRNSQLFQNLEANVLRRLGLASNLPMSGPMGGAAEGDLNGALGYTEFSELGGFDSFDGRQVAAEPLARDFQSFDRESLEVDLSEAFGADLMDLNEVQSAGFAGRVSRPSRLDTIASRGLQSLGGLRGFGRRDRLMAEPAYASHRWRQSQYQYTQWVAALFPAVPPVPAKHTPEDPAWTGEALDVSRRLIRPIDRTQGPFEIRRATTSTDPRWPRTTGVSESVELVAADRWLSWSQSAGSPTIVQWCDATGRGAYSRAFQLGRVRQGHRLDTEMYVPGMRAYADTPLDQSYRQYAVEVLHPAANRVTLVMTAPAPSDSQARVTIDTEQHVVVEFQWLAGGKVTSVTKYADYFSAAGVWWPGTIESLDAEGRVTSRTTQTVEPRDAQAFEARFQAELPDPADSVLLADPGPRIRESEQAVAAGADTVDHRFALLLRACAVQKWDDAFEQFAAIERHVPGRAGVLWMRAALSIAARRNDEARGRLESLADQAVAGAGADTYYRTGYALDQSAQILDANEMLRLLDRVRPVFDRQPPHAHGGHQWSVRRAQQLRLLGRPAEVVALQRELAAAAPWDTSAQTTYTRDLAGSGDLAAGLAWLREQIDRQVPWHEYESDQLRNEYANLLRENGRDAEYAAFMEEWIALEPTGEHIYQQYLGALVFADRMDEANAAALAWLEAARIDERLAPAAQTRLFAAIAYAGGQRYLVHANWMDPMWPEPLAATARHLLASEHHFDLAPRIIDHYRFTPSDESDRLRAEIARRFPAAAGTLAATRLPATIGWVVGRGEIGVGQWKEIAETLVERWQAESEANNRRHLGAAIKHIYTVHFRDSEQLPFMRRRVERAVADSDRLLEASLRNELFQELVSREWRDEYEAEALGLVAHLSAAESESERLVAQITALHQFVDAMLNGRYQADVKKLQDEGHPEELTRTQLAARQSEFRTAADQGVADRLAATLDAAGAGPRDDAAFAELIAWIELERSYLDVRLRRNLEQVAERCWGMLGDAPVALESEDELRDAVEWDAYRRQVIEHMRRERAFATLSYLGARREAPAPLVQRLKDYAAAGVALGGPASDSWKYTTFELLVVWDQPDELERLVREWIRTDTSPAPWQLVLGRLLAERGRIEEAIGLFEAVERASLLSPTDYSVLAGWYLVADQRQKHERAKIGAFKAAQEYLIADYLRRLRQPWYRTDVPLPTELDENVLFGFRALLEKSNQPENYVSELREFYTACRDFRLLAMLPDAVVGRTPQQIYPFLGRLKSDLLYELRNEAAADEILKRVAELRPSRESASDARALDLLEALVERQSADVLNQPGPHIEAAVAALARAFDREWQAGEVRQMAELLDGLGTIAQSRLADERLRQLRALHERTVPGTDDRLYLAWYLSHSLFWSHDRRDEGLATMENAAREYDATHAEGWPAHANTALDGFLQLLEATGRYSAAEQVLQRHIAAPLNDAQSKWLVQRRNRTYIAALAGDGLVSLGGGSDLYRRLEQHLIDQLETIDDDGHRRTCLSQLLQVYAQANEKKFEFQADFRRFASDQLPAILKRQANEYHNLVGETADTMHRLLGAHAALGFVIARFEEYPKRFEATWQDAWQQFSHRMATWHNELDRKSGELEPRLLAIVLAELRRDMVIRQSYHRYFYYHNHYGYWQEKADDFARAAEGLWRERRDSGPSVTYIAQYMFHGLRRFDRAIEMLLVANDEGILYESQQIVLVDMLHERNRHAESIPILQPIVERSPDAMHYRTRLLTAYHRSARPQQLAELLAQTDAHFRQAGRWTEANIAQLAQNCLENELMAEAAAYYGEVISLHQRTAPHRGIGDHTLSHYYSYAARAYSALGNTRRAVESAAAGVIAWGPRHQERQSALHWLERVLADARDLDDYVAELDRQAAETGEDSALIRHYAGAAYAQRGEHQRAVAQLAIAAELQPANVEIRQKMIASYDALDDRAGAVAQTLALLDVDRHNLDLYRSLADRMKSDEAQAERAATTIVEAAPNEALHHQALAELRQQQARWPDAVEHWQHVVRLRSLEPTGFVKLAEAQIQAGKLADAQETVDRLNRTEWPARFTDIRQQIESLQQRLRERG